MKKREYINAIKQPDRYVIVVDSRKGRREVPEVFDSPEEAHEYASAKVAHLSTNLIEIYKTTGDQLSITPYQEHHIGVSW